MSSEQPSWIRHLVTFLIIFALGGFMIYRGGCLTGQQQPGPPEDARVVDVAVDRWLITAEVADTPELRRQGLSGRPSLGPGQGMLFVFPETQTPDFWMRNTTVALSVAFIKADGTVIDVQQMEPKSLRRHTPPEPVKYALEVRQGWFADRGLEVPFKAEIPQDIPAPAAPEPEGQNPSQ